MDDLVECPKCGFTQPESEECIACGIIFAKYWAIHGAPPPEAKPAPDRSAPDSLYSETAQTLQSPSDSPSDAEAGEVPGAQAIAPYQLAQEPPDSPSHASPRSGFDPGHQLAPDAQAPLPEESSGEGVDSDPAPNSTRPTGPPSPRHRVMRQRARSKPTIGASTMVIRTLAAMACLGIAVLMFANGKGLLSVWPYIIMVFYAGAALWGLSSFRQKVTLEQFATEMAVLVLISLVMRFAAPEMFQVESPTQGTPKVVQPYLPKTSLGSFTKRVLVYTEAGRAVLESRDEVSKSQWETWVKQANFPAVKSKYSVLTTEDRARVWDVWKRVEELGPMLTDVLSRYQQSAGERVRFTAPENERAAVKRELDAALLKASQLRARLLIYPDADQGDY